MREEYEFRINEGRAHLLFRPEEGRRLIVARVVTLSSNDSRFDEIGALQKSIYGETGELFFFSYSVKRSYTKAELSEACLFHLRVSPQAYFEPAGEECDTLYDESVACKICGAGARQSTPLRLPYRRIPKGTDLAKTIGGEIVVSQRFVDICSEKRTTGVSFQRIVDVSPRPGLHAWYQLVPDSAIADIVSPTRTGNNPFDEDESNEHRCARGDTIGLNLLSEIFVRPREARFPDFTLSRQFIGRRAGLLRPDAQVIVSQRMGQILTNARLKGFRLEIVRQRP